MNVENKDINFLQDDRMVSSELIFDGAILRLYHNQLKLDSGQIVYRELLHHQPAAAILAVTSENKVLLVKQYRPAIVEDIYEVPAGILDYHDSATEVAEVGALRELEEETGYQAKRIEKIASFYVTPGYLNEEITLFHASELVKVDNPLPQDADEDVTVYEFTKAEIKTMMAKGEIKDLKTLYALQIWLNQ